MTLRQEATISILQDQDEGCGKNPGYLHVYKLDLISRYILLLSLLVKCSACTEGVNRDLIRLIDVEAGLDNVQRVNLSQFTDSIQYISLETRYGFELANASHCFFEEPYIIVSDHKTCILFSYSGKIITRIGANGRGPGEYISVNRVEITPGKRILVENLKRLLEFNIDGEFLDSHNSFQNISNYGVPGRWTNLNDSLLFVQVRNDSGNEYLKGAIIDISGNVRVGYRNYTWFTQERKVASGIHSVSSIYRFGETIGFKEAFNDTLFYLTQDLSLEPAFYLDMGRYKVGFPDLIAGTAFQREYAIVRNTFETKEYIFFDMMGLNNSFRRPSPIQETLVTMSGQMVNRDRWYYDTNHLLIYKKSTGKSTLVDISRLEDDVFIRGLVNDIDGGPNFYPAFMVDETKLEMPVLASELKNHIVSESFLSSIVKNPEKKKSLEKLANSLSDNDNPVLMVVTLK